MIKTTVISERTKLVQLRSKSLWQCNGLAVSTDDGTILIDCNLPGDALDKLLGAIDQPVKAYYVTHMHLDHASNIADVEARGIPVYAPEPELKYISDFKTLLLDSGAIDFGVEKEMKHLFNSIFKYRNIRDISGYTPGMEIAAGSVVIRSVPLPGHSPGHTGFQIIDEGKTLLFTTDTGLEKLGAWYGFRYCSISRYRESVNHLLNLYKEGDILMGSHSDPHYNYNPGLLYEIIEKINISERRILKELNENNPVTIEDLSRKGIYYKKETIDKMEGVRKKLYLFWEHCSIENLLEESEQSGKVKKTDEKTWILNRERVN